MASPSTLANSTPKRFSSATGSKRFLSAISIFLARARTPVRLTPACWPNSAPRFSRILRVVFGDGEQTRDFTFVDNAVYANLLACEAPNAVGKVFNVGCGVRI